MAAVLIVAFGIVFYSQNPNVLRDREEMVVDVNTQQRPSVTPAPVTINESGAQMASSIPLPIATPTPTPLPGTPPDAGEVVAIMYPGFTVVYSVTLGNPVTVQYATVNNEKPKRYQEAVRVKTPDPNLITEAGFMAGPIFSNPLRQTAQGLVVPSAFYRVYRHSYGDTLAFLIPQAAMSPDLTSYLTSIAAIEASTGMTMFSDTIMPEVRNAIASELW